MRAPEIGLMKLFFCDICNESIPLQDIKEAKSATIKGKIFCRKCNPLNELGPTESSTRSSASSALLLVVLVLLLLVASGLGYVIYELKFSSKEMSVVSGELIPGPNQADLNDLRNSLNALESRLTGLGDLVALPGRIAALQEESASAASGQTQLFRDVTELQEGLVAVGRLRERLDGMSLRLEELSQDGDRLTGSLATLAARVESVSAQPASSLATANGIPAESGPEADLGAAAVLDEEVLAMIGQLSATDPMARWEAVDQIRRRQDKSLIPRVVPLLDDRDTFVRTQAIYTLGELKASEAVPKLVKLLRDDEIMIREEALTSLVVITGQNFKFDVTGSRNVREKGIKKWEEWLSKNLSKNEDKF